MDNAGSHRNEYVKNAILESGNKYLFSIPYTPKTNVIEMFFSQIKVLRFNELQKEVKNAIGKVSKENYRNYFLYAYKKEELRKEQNNLTQQQ